MRLNYTPKLLQTPYLFIATLNVLSSLKAFTVYFFFFSNKSFLHISETFSPKLNHSKILSFPPAFSLFVASWNLSFYRLKVFFRTLDDFPFFISSRRLRRFSSADDDDCLQEILHPILFSMIFLCVIIYTHNLFSRYHLILENIVGEWGWKLMNVGLNELKTWKYFRLNQLKSSRNCLWVWKLLVCFPWVVTWSQLWHFGKVINWAYV